MFAAWPTVPIVLQVKAVTSGTSLSAVCASVVDQVLAGQHWLCRSGLTEEKRVRVKFLELLKSLNLETLWYHETKLES